MSSRKEQKEKSFRLIAETALELFFQKGYENTKVTEIAEEANISVGLIFHHYKSKNDIHATLLQQGAENYAEMESMLNKMEGTPYRKIERITEYTLSLLTSHPDAAKLFVLIERNKQNSFYPTSDPSMPQDTIVHLTADLIQQAQLANDVREGHPLLLTKIYWRSFVAFAEEYGKHPKIDIPDTEWFLQILNE